MIEKEIFNLLTQNTIKNINMINFMNNYPVYEIKVAGSSVLVIGQSDQRWVYISSESQKEFLQLQKYFHNEKYFFLTDDWMIPLVTQHKNMDWIFSCTKLYFPEERILPSNKYNILRLSPEHAEYIYNNYDYQHFTSIQYIEERIRNGIGLGICENSSTLVGWCITHDDGAIGFLNVLHEYRQKGYGQELVIAMIGELRKSNSIPFVHIEETNHKSMKLALNTGFIEYGRIHWLKLK